ncbi:MAG TPA: hypothetical protein VFS05_15835 [Gemmatimonadaceae bacterium]|nr:hypothetical protein [Gemmatimonadaceae bacterium]
MTTTRRSHEAARRVAAALLLAATLAVSCVRPPRTGVTGPTRDWLAVFSAAQEAATDGRYAEADSTLAAYASSHQSSREAGEATYWRAVFELDPQNAGRNTHRALEHLDSYLDDSTSAGRHVEARALRAMALTLDSLARAAAEARATADSLRGMAATAPPRATPREEELAKEVQRLKEQLDKTNAELDLIKRRLSAPRRPAASGRSTRP